WGEDPRYFRAPQQPFKGRLQNIVLMTFMARRSDGQFTPALARYVAIPGSNFVSDAWRVDSEAPTRAALARTVWGFFGVLGRNAFIEFWPDAKRKIFHRNR